MRTLFVALFAALLAAGLVACGGGGGGNDEDPQQVLNETFSGNKDINSGNFDLSVNAKASGDQSGSFEAKLGGPFQSSGNGSVPKFDLTASVSGSGNGQNVSFQGGVTSTGQQAFVEYKGQNYEVPASTFNQFKSQYQAQAKTNTQQGGAGLGKLGVKPQNWLTNLSNDGTEDVNGAETIHISGDADVGKAVDDFKKIASQAGSLGVPNAGQLPSGAALNQVTQAVKEAHFDIWVGESDKILRKLQATLKIEPPAGAGSGVDSVDLTFVFGISDLNQPQTISAPSSSKPLSDLLPQLGLGGLGSIPGVSGGSSGGGTSSGGAGGSPDAGPSSAQSQKYLDCLNKAKDAQAIQACAKQLQ
jgi:hypothetical protein